ncbi:NAD-dependent epimerase/dehydratase family protein [Pusillimonas caeni]|uniref:NAD-dependent epimerase/dehydratase family protein n=1 Tax=Pusillimonas caeni TaxID=1348472 RepID=UPI000E59E0BE|nr:NAD-dependent epimerase/dehydratase family protein [Pusillimonas caeni]TFL11287.1 NAD-dependent epimerase/dehydratase family protein [Pusillimonas caeni]
MKQVLVTGANGYIGQALARALAKRLASGEMQGLTLTDLMLDDRACHHTPGVRLVAGDLCDKAVLDAALAPAPDAVFHLASITSRRAEEDFALGLRVNLHGTFALLEYLRRQEQCPVVVFASSIGVFGTPLPGQVDDDTPPAPTLSYGTQKRMVELLLADYSRRGWLDGRSVRLPTVVARPAAADTALSSFASSLIRALAEGSPYNCPIGPGGWMWLLSLPACVEHLMQSAMVENTQLPAGRAWNLPAQRIQVAELLRAGQSRYGPSADAKLHFQPQPQLEKQFAQWPPLTTSIAARLGMYHDGDVDTLIERALASESRACCPDPTTKERISS